MMVVNNPLIRPYFLGRGGSVGAPLDFHEDTQLSNESPTFQLIVLYW